MVQKRRLFLHIGAGKCGSSSIRRFMDVNRDVLNAKGYGIANQHFEWGRGGGNPGNWLGPRRGEGALGNQKVLEQLDACPFPNAVVSAMTLGNERSVELFQGATEKFDISVLYMVRRPEDWLVSAWRQWYHRIGWELERTVDWSVAERPPGSAARPNFLNVAKAWSGLVGPDALRVEALDMISGGMRLEEMIVDWLQVSTDDLDLDPGRANVGIDARFASMLTQFPEVYKDRHDVRIDQTMRKYSELALVGSRVDLTPEYRSKVAKRFDADMRELLGEERAAAIEAKAESKRAARAKAAGPVDARDPRDFALAAALEAISGLDYENRALEKRVRALEAGKTGFGATMSKRRKRKLLAAADAGPAHKAGQRKAGKGSANGAVAQTEASSGLWSWLVLGVDYRVHRLLSKLWFLSAERRASFARGARKRKDAFRSVKLA